MLSKISIDQHSMVSLTLAVEYSSPQGRHRDQMHIEKFNVWRDADLLPADMNQAMLGKQAGYRERFHYSASELIEDSGKPVLFAAARNSFRPPASLRDIIEPQAGRFYPKGWFAGVNGLTSDNMGPARVVHIDDDAMQIDLVHPLFGHELDIEIQVESVYTHFEERGGRCNDCVADLLNGPGMQLRYENRATDFFSAQPFARGNEDNDAVFYAMPRMVNHLDDTALEQVSALYAELLPADARILDLMSSINSHLPESLAVTHLSGLGMNMEELAANPALHERLVHDLNREPVLPFDDASFDAVICTVSVEYLRQPLEIFDEVARVLKPGGVFITTFSNRWFPGKEIQLWPWLHEFERMGLVSEYFLHGGAFENVNTRSIRGLPRPEHDPHPVPLSDPVYAVWGTKIR